MSSGGENETYEYEDDEYSEKRTCDESENESKKQNAVASISASTAASKLKFDSLVKKKESESKTRFSKRNKS